MRWLRQQRKVETLDRAAQANAGKMSQLRQRLAQRVHARLQQPGSLAWAFAAGCLYGNSRPRAGDRKPEEGQQQHAPVPVLRYLNSAVIAWNLWSRLQPEQPPP